MNIHVHVFTRTNVFISLAYIPKSGFAQSFDISTLHIFLAIYPTCQGSYHFLCFTDKGSKALNGKEIAQDHEQGSRWGWIHTPVM